MPWARPGSGFMLLFEAMVVEPAKSQPVADIAEQAGGHDTRPWRLIRHYVQEVRLYEDHTGMEAIGIDETSRKGHRCITVVADLTERNVICVVPGKAEARESPLLKRTKCLWPRNESNLTDPQLEVRRDLAKQRSKTAKACGMRERLQDIHTDSASRTEAETGSKALCSWMMHSRLEPMKALAGQFRRHWQDILAYFDHRRANAILEGRSGIIRHVKTRSRGFRNMDHSGTMIYLTCGELGLNTVTA